MAIFSMNGYDSYSGCDIVVTASLPSNGENESTYFVLGSLQTLSVSTHQDKRPVRSLGNINAKDYVMGQRTIAGSLVFAVFDRHFADKIMKTVEVMMPDEIPALNLTINFANEYGRSSRMAIYGVKLLNEGQVMSINDLYTENTYQFVALGMEPLSADEEREGDSTGTSGSSGGSSIQKSSKKQTPQIITQEAAAEEVIESRTFRASGGKIISDTIKNNSDYSNKETITLTVSIEQPVIGELTGIATLTLTPKQSEGFIYITNLVSGESDVTIQIDGSSTYSVELPIGYYNAIYMNTTRSKESNIEKIIIRQTDTSTVKDAEFKARSAYPIIENLTNDTVSVSIYNNDFSDIACFSSGDGEKTKPNKNKVVTFTGLRPETEYKIYASNGNIESNTITIKTLPSKNSYYTMFKEFLMFNRNMLQNDYDAIVKELETLLVNREWQYDNIINGLMDLKNSLLKQELLLYAIQFENSMIDAYNITNPNKLKITRDDVFDTDLSIGNWAITKYYSHKDKKPRLEGMVSSENPFVGKPNTVYSLYGIEDNVSSIKKYLTVFSTEGKEFLTNYRNVNKYKTLDLSYHKSTYPECDSYELYALSIRDNHLCDKQLLEAPVIFEEDGKIYADVIYDDKILLDDRYYLCVSEIYSTLDNMPCRKIAFDRQTKEINLSDLYIPFDTDYIYHAWVENIAGNVISKTFIFNHKQSTGLANALDKELLRTLNEKKRLLLTSIQNKNNGISDIFNHLYAESVSYKDLDNRLELEIVKYADSSYYVSEPVSEVIYETVLQNISNKLAITRSNNISFYKNRDQFYIKPNSELSLKVVTKSYSISDDKVTCKIHYPETNIDVEGDYMAIYLINEHIDKVLGLIVIDCGNYKFKSIGFNVEVGDK